MEGREERCVAGCNESPGMQCRKEKIQANVALRVEFPAPGKPVF
jgi:hypothetical protein